MACESCEEQKIDACRDHLNAECIIVTEDLQCTGVQANTLLSTALKRMDEVICQVKNKVAGTLSLVNIGGGEQIYRGVNNIGEREIRTLQSIDNRLVITEELDTIDFSLDITIPEVESATTEIEGIVRQATDVEAAEGINNDTYVTPLHLKTFVDENGNEYSFRIFEGNAELLKNGEVQDSQPLPTGVNTYADGFNLDGNDLVITRTDGEELRQDMSSLLNFTQVQSDYTQENASEPSYIKNRNASKTVYADYPVKPEDNTYVIVIDSPNPVTISLPTTLPNKFTVGFIQKGTGLVTIANADIVPEGMVNTIKGKGHQAFVEKIEGTKFLFGNLNKEA